MKRRDMSTLSLVTQLGVTVVTALILSLLLGLWLDSRLGTSPLFTLVFSLFGILIGTIGVYRLVTRAIAESVAEQPRARSSPKPPADSSDEAASADPWADEDAEQDDWDRDPWRDEDDPAQEKRRARREDAERRLGLRPPEANPRKPEEEEK
jgi:ATP synthase protein I